MSIDNLQIDVQHDPTHDQNDQHDENENGYSRLEPATQPEPDEPQHEAHDSGRHDRPAPTFADLDVQPEIVAALDRVGITHPFPIQALTLPVAMTGHDIIGQAKTGTGKTLGFSIPTLQRVVGPGEAGFEELDSPGKPQALVVVPTRELAVQVAGDVATAGAGRSARVLTVYGGRAYEPQIEALRKGIEIVVGTPGRLIDLAQQKHLDLGHARIVVLDEADEMLDLGFLPDVEKLLGLTPEGRQTMLFSATMPSAVVALARRYMTQPTHIRAHSADDTGATVKATKQYAYRAHSLDKVEMLARVLQSRDRGLTIIFARTKRSVAKVADELAERGFASAAIHGDLGQGAREQALRAFRNGKVDVLVATDVAARGIDVDDVTHVVNYQCPEDEKTYLHRIGRTGRAGNTGTAITLVDWDDLMRWALIDKALDLGMPDLQETYSSSPHLYSDLDIPEGTRGTLPRTARTRAGLDAEEVEDLGETGRGPRGGADKRGSGRSSSGRSGSGRGGSGRSDSGRSDSGRSDTGRGGSGRSDSGRGGSGQGDIPTDGEATRPRRERQRRRTRSGASTEGLTVVDSAAGSGPSGASSSGSASSGSASNGTSASVNPSRASANPADSPGAEGAPSGAPRRRRRRRGGSRSSSEPAT